MRMRNRKWTALIAVMVLATSVGCPSGNGTDQPAGRPTDQRVTPSDETAGKPDPVPVEITPEPLPLAIPPVRMTESDRATCRVAVGNILPEARLPDLQGNLQLLRQLYGERLTVVFLWTSGKTQFSALRAAGALEDLQKDVVEPYSAKGVRVIAINEHDASDVIARQVSAAGAAYPNLLDPGGAFFASVATEKLPRIYVLDAKGKILWFDLEYSETTRHDLKQTIRVFVGG